MCLPGGEDLWGIWFPGFLWVSQSNQYFASILFVSHWSGKSFVDDACLSVKILRSWCPSLLALKDFVMRKQRTLNHSKSNLEYFRLICIYQRSNNRNGLVFKSELIFWEGVFKT